MRKLDPEHNVWAAVCAVLILWVLAVTPVLVLVWTGAYAK